MYSKNLTHLLTLAISNGLNIDGVSEPELTLTLAEIGLDDFPDVPQIEWESDSTVCHSWVSFKDWELDGICAATDEGDGGNRPRDSETTIDELKDYAESKQYDGFSIFYGEQRQRWKRRGVWYKKCDVEEQEKAHISHALTKKQGVEFYWHMAHPCSPEELLAL